MHANAKLDSEKSKIIIQHIKFEVYYDLSHNGVKCVLM